jgi:hypothetical protein
MDMPCAVNFKLPREVFMSNISEASCAFASSHGNKAGTIHNEASVNRIITIATNSLENPLLVFRVIGASPYDPALLRVTHD